MPAKYKWSDIFYDIPTKLRMAGRVVFERCYWDGTHVRYVTHRTKTEMKKVIANDRCNPMTWDEVHL